ncbi:hypothetical protein Fmac_030021 [Flemingia macrophylla]|uniref:Mitochondrial inner membrane protease subunit n=1 Tax=Flemingia macrophylla TaxID=520843 RepID=A0ABD1LC10_9FABA
MAPSSFSTLCRYFAAKAEYTLLSLKSYEGGGERDFIYKTMLLRKLTYLYRNEGDQVAPTGGKGEILLVRKLPIAAPKQVSVGDLVVLKNPEKEDNYLVRRLTAIEGYEMVSTNDKDEPFVLEKDQCWVEAENKNLKPKEARDSRSFGPVDMTDIVGRVIYRLRTCVDHGCVRNSHSSMLKDWPVLAVELDVEEMSKNHKA